jgi:hypothetical protein
MSGALETVGPPGRSQTTHQLSWVSHPVRTSHDKTLILMVVTALTGAFVFAATGSTGWALVAVAFLILGVHDYLIPTHFRLDERGVERQILFFRRRKPWSQLRSFHPDRNGVLVSPFPIPTRLDTFRGIYLRFDDERSNRDDVVAFVRGHVRRGADG